MSNDQPPIEDDSGRLALAVGGILFIPLSVMGTWGVFFVIPMPQGFWGWVARLIADELAISATVFFTVGFVWGITGNRGLKKLVDIAAVRIAWIVFPMLSIAFAGAAFIFLWKQLLG